MSEVERPEVPQATLERTREIVDALARGARDRAEVSAASGVALRQVAYGVASARVLGLVEGDDALRLTDLGRELAAMESGSAAENELLRRALEASASLAAIAPGLLSDAPPPREEVAARIRAQSGLSPNTAAHRAGMLFGWRKRLVGGVDPRDVKERQLGARWRRLEVAGFRSLEQLSLDVGPLTVVHGPTASGKTSVVDALVLAHELAVDAESALARRGGFERVARHGRGPLVLEHRVAATREALDRSYRRHRVTLEGDAASWSLAREEWSVLHQGAPLVEAKRVGEVAVVDGVDVPVGPREAMLERAAVQRALGRHVAVRGAFRLALDPARMVEPEGGADARMRPDGANLASALLRLKESRSYPGLLEALRNVVPGLVDVWVELDECGPLGYGVEQTLAPDVTVRLGAEQLSLGTRLALGTLVAAHQLGPDELLVVELSELPLDPASLALVLEALVAASRRASVVVTTADDDLAQAIAADVVVHCRFRGGRTEVAAPGLRVVGAGPLFDGGR